MLKKCSIVSNKSLVTNAPAVKYSLFVLLLTNNVTLTYTEIITYVLYYIILHIYVLK